MDTIFATSSGSPPAAIAIVRVSGPCALASARLLAGALPPFRTVALRALRDPNDGRLLDRALVLAFDGPQTATGEDVVEFHVHGGRAVVAAVERALLAIPALRRAEPGEFTRQALTNGVIDLTEAEGLGDLLAAETETQRRAALDVAEGGLRALIQGWTDTLVGIAARIEAMLDFAEEDEVAAESLTVLATGLGMLSRDIARLLSQPPVERLKDGVRVVLAGPPNSGKSTLLNALAQRDVAIVSPVSGTTRDRIEVPVVRGGIAYLLTDTAGLADDSDDPVERLGIARARAAAAAADILLWLGDTAPEIEGAYWVHTRSDLPGRAERPAARSAAISAQTGAGLAELWTLLQARAAALLPKLDIPATNQRQRLLLEEASACLDAAECADDMLVMAEEVRLALRVFDRIVGRADVEAVLDAVFSRFCLGK